MQKSNPKLKTLLTLALISLTFAFWALNINSASADITSGLVAHYKFDEGAGTTAGDSSGNNNTGTLINGPTRTLGKIGQALNFDGVDDFVNVGTSATYEFGLNSFSVSTWFYTPANLTNEYILSRVNGAYTTGWNIGVSGVSTLNWIVLNGVSSANATMPSFALSQWHHAVGVVDRTANRSYLYVDGVLQGNVSIAGFGAVDAVGANLNFGRNSGGGTQFNGLIDEVRVYNRALTEQEIRQLYLMGK